MAADPEFDPRRAEPGQTFAHYDPAPAGAEDRLAREHTFSADDEGVLRPTKACEARHADQLGLPVARKALAADKEA